METPLKRKIKIKDKDSLFIVRLTNNKHKPTAMGAIISDLI